MVMLTLLTLSSSLLGRGISGVPGWFRNIGSFFVFFFQKFGKRNQNPAQDNESSLLLEKIVNEKRDADRENDQPL